jgi:monooxygenase
MAREHFDVLIIGAGLAGVGTACQLRAALPHKSVALIERRDHMGGTWDLFRYPGIRSDVDMLTLGYRFRPWRDPSVVAHGPAIRQYIADTAQEYGVDDRIHYGQKVTEADWSTRDQRWTVHVVGESSGESRQYTCHYLINCTGYYDHDAGYLPDFPGVGRFRGRFIHPQQWPEDLDYSGRNVVVIGSGATAVTLVPAMAEVAGHVTMLQRSPSYVMSLPAFDRISERLERVLPTAWVYALARKRNIVFQRKAYLACRRWPRTMRRILLWHARRQVGPAFDMSHLTPRYMPFDERLCVASDGDFFKVLSSGAASVVTDEIDTFTEKGIRLKSGRELESDVVVAATGLNLQMLGGMRLSVDGEPRALNDQMTYKSLLIQDIPNFAWFFGYTNAAYTLKSDIAGAYLCRLFRHMDEGGYAVATPHDDHDCSTGAGVLDDFQSGYVQRSKGLMPRQGTRPPWQILMHYEKDCRMLLDDPIDDGVLRFETANVAAPPKLRRSAW